MPSLCKNNVKASFYNGIVLAVWSLLSFVLTWNFRDFIGTFWPLFYGIFGVLVSGILLFGASEQNPTAILVWIGFALIGVIAYAIWAIITVIYLTHLDSSFFINPVLCMICPLFIGGELILFQIWTILVAKRARDKICNKRTNEQTDKLPLL